MSTAAAAAASAMKLTRVKSFVKRWQGLARADRVHTFSEGLDIEEDDGNLADCTEQEEPGGEDEAPSSRGWSHKRMLPDVGGSSAASAHAPDNAAVVFVGKARRRYSVHARHLQHPLFKALQQRSETSGINQSDGLTLGCEVVLFEHLLWMLDSNDPALQTDSIFELAELYMPAEGSSVVHALQR